MKQVYGNDFGLAFHWKRTDDLHCNKIQLVFKETGFHLTLSELEYFSTFYFLRVNISMGRKSKNITYEQMLESGRIRAKEYYEKNKTFDENAWEKELSDDDSTYVKKLIILVEDSLAGADDEQVAANAHVHRLHDVQYSRSCHGSVDGVAAAL